MGLCARHRVCLSFCPSASAPLPALTASPSLSQRNKLMKPEREQYFYPATINTSYGPRISSRRFRGLRCVWGAGQPDRCADFEDAFLIQPPCRPQSRSSSLPASCARSPAPAATHPLSAPVDFRSLDIAQTRNSAVSVFGDCAVPSARSCQGPSVVCVLTRSSTPLPSTAERCSVVWVRPIVVVPAAVGGRIGSSAFLVFRISI